LRNEKNSVVIAQKMSEVQSEVSELLARKEIMEDQFAKLESEWMNAIQNADKNSSWLRAGELARQKMDFAKWSEALAKVSAETSGKIDLGEKKQFVKNQWLEKNTELLNETSDAVGAYEKAISIGCDKLSGVGFVCPIMEDSLKNYKKTLANHGKTIASMEKKVEKMSTDKQIEEWEKNETTWREMNEELNRIQSEVKNALRNVRNAGIERVAELKRESGSNRSEEILSAVAKADAAIERGEFGKGLFVAQSVLLYVSGSKATGLVSLPPVVWPIVGVIFLVGVWIAWKEWKKKNKVVIQKQVIPRALPIQPTDSKISESEHPTTRGERQLVRTKQEEQYTRGRRQALSQKIEEN